MNNKKMKTVLITGASQGIGKVMAMKFARKGFSVAIADINQDLGKMVEKEIIALGAKVLFIKADLSKERDIKKMIDSVVKRYGGLDHVINNARPKLSVASYAENIGEWDLAMDVLLKAPALTVKYALPYLKKSKGSIINMVSTNAFFISHQPASYHVAKAGLVQLTKYLAAEFGYLGIRSNAICPGLVDLYDGNKPLTGNKHNKVIAECVVPLGRAAKAEEIAQAVLFLCSDEAAYITGQILHVDGGITLGDHFHVARKAYFRNAIDKIKGE